MDYEEMSNEELYQLLMENVPGADFKEVSDYNRQTVIAILWLYGDEARRSENVQP